jgi:hypothetical protein
MPTADISRQNLRPRLLIESDETQLDAVYYVHEYLFDVNSILGLSYYIDMGKVADASEVCSWHLFSRLK